MALQQNPTDPPRSKLPDLSLKLAAFALVAVYLGLALAVFGGRFYSGSFVAFSVLIWIGFPTSLIALLLAIYSLFQERTFTAALTILICVSLYVSYVCIGLAQP